jgi:hypothetical protein
MKSREKMHVITGGLILIALGILIILNSMGLYEFGKSWPILLIVIAAGALIQRVGDFGGWIIAAVGIFFLVKENWGFEFYAAAKYILPILLILLGANILARNYKRKSG